VYLLLIGNLHTHIHTARFTNRCMTFHEERGNREFAGNEHVIILIPMIAIWRSIIQQSFSIGTQTDEYFTKGLFLVCEKDCITVSVHMKLKNQIFSYKF